MTSLALVLLANTVCVQASAACYWNAECPYQLYSSKTPYDTIRGDIRDQPVPQNCEAVSIWTLNRHGNRYPDYKGTTKIKNIASLKDEIIASYEAGSSQLCAQDVDNFRKWTWHKTLENFQFLLTSTGYEEPFNIGKRLREKYPQLLHGPNNDYDFRSANESLFISSAVAFVHGLTEGTNISVTPDEVMTRDEVTRPFETCDRYQVIVNSSQQLDYILSAYFTSAEYFAVQTAVQQRLGINTQLSTENIYTLYEICRFGRSWNKDYKSPWCAVFSDQDLMVLEYKDDVRHYHKSGYGSWVNVKLGGLALKDLYESFEASINGQGKKVTSYFTHVTMMEMVFSAMGIFKDAEQLRGSYRNPNRLWRTSINGGFSANIVAVLNSCVESDNQSYRVQLFINEKETELCPLEGCSWEQFQEKFQGFKSANLDFCSMKYTSCECSVRASYCRLLLEPYQLYSAKTPYDTIRGDIRDHPVPQNCEAVSIWVLCRHGNRYPDYVATNKMMHIASLKHEIVASHEAGRSQLCAQDIENLRRWAWDETLEVSQYLLTDTGYHENYKIGKRLGEKYPHLLQGSNDDYYFRTTDNQLSITSMLSFIHGLTEGTNLTLTPDEARTRDDVIRVNIDKNFLVVGLLRKSPAGAFVRYTNAQQYCVNISVSV